MMEDLERKYEETGLILDKFVRLCKSLHLNFVQQIQDLHVDLSLDIDETKLKLPTFECFEEYLESNKDDTRTEESQSESLLQQVCEGRDGYREDLQDKLAGLDLDLLTPNATRQSGHKGQGPLLLSCKGIQTTPLSRSTKAAPKNLLHSLQQSAISEKSFGTAERCESTYEADVSCGSYSCSKMPLSSFSDTDVDATVLPNSTYTNTPSALMTDGSAWASSDNLYGSFESASNTEVSSVISDTSNFKRVRASRHSLVSFKLPVKDDEILESFTDGSSLNMDTMKEDGQDIESAKSTVASISIFAYDDSVLQNEQTFRESKSTPSMLMDYSNCVGQSQNREKRKSTLFVPEVDSSEIDKQPTPDKSADNVSEVFEASLLSQAEENVDGTQSHDDSDSETEAADVSMADEEHERTEPEEDGLMPEKEEAVPAESEVGPDISDMMDCDEDVFAKSGNTSNSISMPKSIANTPLKNDEGPGAALDTAEFLNVEKEEASALETGRESILSEVEKSNDTQAMIPLEDESAPVETSPGPVEPEYEYFSLIEKPKAKVPSPVKEKVNKKPRGKQEQNNGKKKRKWPPLNMPTNWIPKRKNLLSCLTNTMVNKTRIQQQHYEFRREPNSTIMKHVQGTPLCKPNRKSKVSDQMKLKSLKNSSLFSTEGDSELEGDGDSNKSSRIQGTPNGFVVIERVVRTPKSPRRFAIVNSLLHSQSKSQGPVNRSGGSVDVAGEVDRTIEVKETCKEENAAKSVESRPAEVDDSETCHLESLKTTLSRLDVSTGQSDKDNSFRISRRTRKKVSIGSKRQSKGSGHLDSDGKMDTGTGSGRSPNNKAKSKAVSVLEKPVTETAVKESGNEDVSNLIKPDANGNSEAIMRKGGKRRTTRNKRDSASSDAKAPDVVKTSGKIGGRKRVSEANNTSLSSRVIKSEDTVDCVREESVHEESLKMKEGKSGTEGKSEIIGSNSLLGGDSQADISVRRSSRRKRSNGRGNVSVGDKEKLSSETAVVLDSPGGDQSREPNGRKGQARKQKGKELRRSRRGKESDDGTQEDTGVADDCCEAAEEPTICKENAQDNCSETLDGTGARKKSRRKPRSTRISMAPSLLFIEECEEASNTHVSPEVGKSEPNVFAQMNSPAVGANDLEITMPHKTSDDERARVSPHAVVTRSLRKRGVKRASTAASPRAKGDAQSPKSVKRKAKGAGQKGKKDGERSISVTKKGRKTGKQATRKDTARTDQPEAMDVDDAPELKVVEDAAQPIVAAEESCANARKSDACLSPPLMLLPPQGVRRSARKANQRSVADSNEKENVFKEPLGTIHNDTKRTEKRSTATLLNSGVPEKRKRSLFNGKNTSLMSLQFSVMHDVSNCNTTRNTTANTSGMPPTLSSFLKSFVAPKIKKKS